MTFIHPTAMVDPKAQIGENCHIGPYCQIGPNVSLGNDNYLVSNVIIDGHTTIGNGNKISPYAVLGTGPQDLKYAGEPTQLFIGDDNTIREFVTVNRSALLEEPTRVGSHNLLMTYAHVAHNCQLGNYIIMANSANLAGHIHIQDFATVGGLTAVHQFVQIGKYSFVGGASAVKKDVPPFTRGQGNPYNIVGLNSVGLMRKGFSTETVAQIKRIYKLFYYSGLNTTQALEEAATWDLCPEQQDFVDFVKNSHRGISK